MEHLILRLIESGRGRVVIALLLLVIGSVFCLIARPDVYDARRLRASRVEVDAEVVATRALSDQHFNTSYDLRYRFRVPRDAVWHTAQERGTGRSDLWSSLPRTEWERARATGTVRVVHVPDDPRINRPVAAETRADSDSTSGLVLGTVCLVGGAVWLALMAVTTVVRGGRDAAASSAGAGNASPSPPSAGPLRRV